VFDLAAGLKRENPDRTVARTRAAKTFGLSPPRRPPGPITGETTSPRPTRAVREAALIASRVLAAAGPQDIEVLRATVGRASRSRPRTVPGRSVLAAALRVLGADTDGLAGGRRRPISACPARPRP
jgi:hypothetical protein